MLPLTCQMLLFSATFEESVWNFARRIVPDPNIIKLKREEETLDTIKQYYVLCNSKEEKFQALCNIYGAITIAQAMIFCHVSLAAESKLSGLRTVPRGTPRFAVLTLLSWQSNAKMMMAMMLVLTVATSLFDPDEEDCRLAGRRAVQREPPGGAAQRRNAGGAEGCSDRPLQGRQGEGPGHHQCLRSR